MSKYTVLWVADENNARDYRDRQLYANSQGAICYIDGHLNSKVYTWDVDGDGDADADAEGTADNPTMCLVCDNASQTSKNMAKYFADKCAEAFGYKSKGCVVMNRGTSRGYWNLYYTNMPAVLLEGLWVSDVEQATLAMSDQGKETMAKIIVAMVKEHFPNGGKVALCVGHKFKKSNPHDRGAPVVGGNGLGEADIMLEVFKIVEQMFEGIWSLEPEEPSPPTERPEVVLPPSEGATRFTILGQWEASLDHWDGKYVTTLRRRDG